VAQAAGERAPPGPVALQLAAAVEQERGEAARLLERLGGGAVAALLAARQLPADAIVDDDEVQRPERELELLAASQAAAAVFADFPAASFSRWRSGVMRTTLRAMPTFSSDQMSIADRSTSKRPRP
jgi:hypothetical protein